jgi:hypothetical protein
MRNKRGGRPPKTEKQKVRYTVNFTETENAEFLAQYEQSGASTISKFIAACVFNRQLKVVKIDKAAFDFYVKLTEFHSQFRAIGVNYNQVVRAIKTTFTEKKALAFLYKLENATRELVATNQKVIDLIAEFERKHLLKNQ